MDSFFLDNQNIRGARTIAGTILEKKQIKIQGKIILNWEELYAVKTYSGHFHKQINGYIRKNSDWEKYFENQLNKEFTEDEIIKEIEDLDSAMKKTPSRRVTVKSRSPLYANIVTKKCFLPSRSWVAWPSTVR